MNNYSELSVKDDTYKYAVDFLNAVLKQIEVKKIEITVVYKIDDLVPTCTRFFPDGIVCFGREHKSDFSYNEFVHDNSKDYTAFVTAVIGNNVIKMEYSRSDKNY